MRVTRLCTSGVSGLSTVLGRGALPDGARSLGRGREEGTGWPRLPIDLLPLNLKELSFLERSSLPQKRPYYCSLIRYEPYY